MAENLQKWRRVWRSAGAKSELRKLADDIRFKHRERLISLASQDLSPVEGLSEIMQESLPAELLAKRSTRLFVGLAVGALMAEEGFEPVGVKRIKGNAIFSWGTRFERVLEPSVEPRRNDLLERLVSVLTPDEKDTLQSILSRGNN